MYKGGCKLFVEQIIEDASKTEDARQEDACLHLPVSLSACIKGFTKEIRKKVHRLLYHSLCTNVAEKKGSKPLISLWGIHDFRSCALDQLRDFSVLLKILSAKITLMICCEKVMPDF